MQVRFSPTCHLAGGGKELTKEGKPLPRPGGCQSYQVKTGNHSPELPRPPLSQSQPEVTVKWVDVPSSRVRYPDDLYLTANGQQEIMFVSSNFFPIVNKFPFHLVLKKHAFIYKLNIKSWKLIVSHWQKKHKKLAKHTSGVSGSIYFHNMHTGLQHCVYKTL